MSGVINGVPRELLELIEQSWRVPNGYPKSVSSEAEEKIVNGLRELRALLTAQPQASALTEAAPGCFVQPVPSHCDRITWRGNYYQLPDGLTQASAAQSAPAGEREAFEAAATGFSLPLDESTHRGTFYEDDRTFWMHRGWQSRAAWQRTQSAGVPDGCRLVPAVATLQMKNAGWQEIDRQGIDPESCEIQTIYHAMLAAAPAQGQQVEQWIPVSEQLPEVRKTHRDYCSTDVLVSTPSVGVAIAQYHHNGTWLVGSFGHRDITHWMPLPAAPNKGGDV